MTDREIAIGVWFIISALIVLVLSIKNMKLRKNVLGVFQAFFNLFKNFIMQFLFVYTLSILALFIYLLYRWDFDFSLLFTFLIFTVTTYIPIISNTTLSDDISFESKKYFKRVFSGAVLGAVLVTSYTFSFIVEFILIIPPLFILGMVKAYLEYYKNNKEVENIVNKLITFIGFIVLLNWIIQFARNLSDLITLEFWLSFTVDFWGILAYIPAILILPYFLSIDRKIRFYTNYSNFDYFKLHVQYWILNRKYKRRDSVNTFDIYKMELHSKPFKVFSVYGEVDKKVDIEKLNYDIQTFCLKLRSGNFDEHDKLANIKSIKDPSINVYADVIYFYFSIKGEHQFYPWYKMYLWRNPRLSQKYMSIKVKWVELEDNLLMRPID